MRPVQENLESWAGGVVTTLEADAIPPSASPRGRNSALQSAGADRAAVAKRRGLKLRNATQITSTPQVIGQFGYKRLGAGAYTRYHLLISDGGRLDRLNDDGTLSVINATALQAGENFPDFAQANNLAFMVNGQTGGTFSGRLKYDGTITSNFGITRPTVGTLAGAAGAAGVHNGTYELRVTYYNSATGHESSISNSAAANVVLANQQCSWTNIPTSGDAQVTDRRLYMRNTATMAQFYRVATVAGNVTTTATTNVSDAALLLLQVGPDTSENDPPLVGVKNVCYHQQHMFVSDDTNIYWSKLNLPEAFDPDSFQPVNANDGQKIVGMLSYQEVLLILKERSVWALIGDDPDKWYLRIVDASIGCTSHRSIVQAEGSAAWWSDQGPVTIAELGPSIPIGLTLIQPTVGPDKINFNRLFAIPAATDIVNQRWLWAVPEFNPEGEPSSTRNNIILPYNYRLKRWEADRWDPMDVASFGVTIDENGKPWVYIGGYKGQVFRLWAADNDGVNSGTVSGTVTSATANTLADTTAAFDITGGGLAQRYLYAVDPTGNIQRRRIGSNTATVLTLDAALTWAITPNSNYTYVVGGIDWQWDTYWFLHERPFDRKRYTFVYAQLKTPTAATVVNADVFLNYSNAYTKTIPFTVNPGGGIWDQATWDVSRWADQAAANFRLRIGLVGIATKIRIRNYKPDQPLVLLKIGIAGEALNDKIG